MISIFGPVINGKQEGLRIGFPTANIALPKGSGLSGSYVARVVVEGKEYIAAAYADTGRGLLESHLLDFSGNLQGKEISVSIEKKIRDVEHFSDVGVLKAAIASDVAKVREYFHH